jgi:hypothetical protein
LRVYDVRTDQGSRVARESSAVSIRFTIDVIREDDVLSSAFVRTTTPA